MPVLIDALSIVNSACAQIGAEPLTSLDEETIGGQAADLLYLEVIDMCLDVAPWSFAEYAVELSKLDPLAAGASKFGHSAIFQMPADRLGPPTLLMWDVSVPDAVVTKFALEADRVHASVDRLWGVFKFRAHPANWPGTFKAAATTALAARLAVALSHDIKLAQAKTDEAFGSPSQFPRGGLMGTALQVDGRAKPARALPAQTNPLLQGHLGGWPPRARNGW